MNPPDLPDELRRRAKRFRDLLPRSGRLALEGITLGTVENGVGSVILVRWIERQGRAPIVSIRVFTESANGELVPSGVGIEVTSDRLPGLADGLAKALEVAEEAIDTYYTRGHPADGRGR